MTQPTRQIAAAAVVLAVAVAIGFVAKDSATYLMIVGAVGAVAGGAAAAAAADRGNLAGAVIAVAEDLSPDSSRAGVPLRAKFKSGRRRQRQADRLNRPLSAHPFCRILLHRQMKRFQRKQTTETTTGRAIIRSRRLEETFQGATWLRRLFVCVSVFLGG